MKLLPKLRTALSLSTVAVALLFSHSASAEALRLNFGVYSSNKPSSMVRIFKPTLNELEARMSEKLGRQVDIRMQIAKDYDQGISHLTTGKVDFSRFGPASYIEAKKMNEGIEILAMESKKGEKVFYGVIATKNDSEIQSIEDLRGKSFAFGDEGSTIGRFLSQLYLEQNNIRADDLSKYEYLGRHDLVGTAVGAGDFAAGALNDSTYKKLIDAGEPLRTLAKFPNVTKPWIARSGLDPVIYEALQLSLLEITDEKALKGLKAQGFLLGDDTDYAVIREAMDFNFKFFEKPKLKDAKAASAPAKASSTQEKTETETAIAASETSETENILTIGGKQPIEVQQPTAAQDKNAVVAASSVLADQTNLGTEPTIGSAIPTAASAAGALSSAQQENAALAARALATQTAKSTTVQTRAQVNTTPSAYAVNGNNLTINIALPRQLMSGYDTGNNSQNVTINLTFPADQVSAAQ